MLLPPLSIQYTIMHVYNVQRIVAMDEAIVAAARDQAGPDCEIMVDAGGSDAY